jgi:CubicO group peptidase (beta-lactamase class C family)
MKRFALFILLCVCFHDASAQRFQRIADSVRRAFRIPEFAVAVVKPDTIPFMYVCGYHRDDQQTAADTALMTDYFHLGSNTKAITGFIAAWLVERGKLKWNTKFFELYPTWRKGTNDAYKYIDLADLLSHRARIQPFTSGPEFQKLPEFKGANVAERRAEFGKYLLHQAPVEIDDKPFHYSNAGYTLAALMLEKVSGKTWEQLVQEVISKRLHLKYMMGWPNRKNEKQPWGHWSTDDIIWEPLPPDITYDLRLVEPAGDVSMPLPDYARFIQLNLQGQEGESNFLKARTYQYLHFGLDKYSIGWANREENGSVQTVHAGSAGTFFCYTLVDKTIGTAYIIIANAGGDCAKGAVETMLRILKAQTW